MLVKEADQASRSVLSKCLTKSAPARCYLLHASVQRRLERRRGSRKRRHLTASRNETWQDARHRKNLKSTVFM